MTWNITVGQYHWLIIALIFKNSLGVQKMLLYVDRNASLKKTIRFARRTLRWRNTDNNQNVLSTQRRCGRRETVTKPESGSIGVPAVTNIRAMKVVWIFTFQITHSPASTRVRNSTFEF